MGVKLGMCGNKRLIAAIRIRTVKNQKRGVVMEDFILIVNLIVEWDKNTKKYLNFLS